MDSCVCGEKHCVVDDLHNRAHPEGGDEECPHGAGSLAGRSIFLHSKHVDHGYSGLIEDEPQPNENFTKESAEHNGENDSDIGKALNSMRLGQYKVGINHLLQHSDSAREQIIQVIGDLIEGEVHAALDIAPLLRKNIKALKLEEYNWEEVLEVYEQVCPLFSVCMKAALMKNPDQICVGDHCFQAVMGVLMSVIFFVLRPEKDNNVLKYMKSLTKWLPTWRDRVEESKIKEEEAQREAQIEVQRQAQLEAEAAHQALLLEAEIQRQTELEAQHNAEQEKMAQRQAELEAEAQHNAQLRSQQTSQLDAEAQRKAQLDAQRKVQLEAQHQAQQEFQRQAEIEAQSTSQQANPDSIILHIAPEENEGAVQYAVSNPNPFAGLGETFTGEDGTIYIQTTVQKDDGTEQILLVVPDMDSSSTVLNLQDSNTFYIEDSEGLSGASNIQFVIKDETNNTGETSNEQYISVPADGTANPIEALPINVSVDGENSETLSLEQVLHRIVNLDGTCPEPSSPEGTDSMYIDMEEANPGDLGQDSLEDMSYGTHDNKTTSDESDAETIGAEENAPSKVHHVTPQTVNYDQTLMTICEDLGMHQKSEDGSTLEIDVPEGLTVGEPFIQSDEPKKGIWASENLPQSTSFGPYSNPFAKRKRFPHLPLAYWASFLQLTCFRSKQNLKAVTTPQGLYYRTKGAVGAGTELVTWRHLHIYNCGRKPKECTKCSFKPIVRRKKSDFQEEKSWHKCHECDKVFIKLGSYKRHKLIHRPAKPFVCEICDKKFDRRNPLDIHIRSHTGERPFGCVSCGASFASSGRLHRHERIHTNDRPFPCPVCNKTFRNTNDVDRHLKVHIKAGKHQCPKCDQLFASLCDKYNHMQTHMDIKDPDLQEGSSSSEPLPPIVKLENLDEEQEQDIQDIKPFLCAECGKAFISLKKLQAHRVVHKSRDSNVCEHCGKGFYKRADLERHIRTHTGERPFVCEECGQAFGAKYNRDAHVLMHKGEAPFVCKYCNKGFTKSWSLKSHLQVHTRDRSKDRSRRVWTVGMSGTPYKRTGGIKREVMKPYTCELCNKDFPKLQSLKRHMEVHDDANLHVCPECGKAFKGPTVLAVHLLKHTGEKPYVCQVCSKGFANPGFLNWHMRSHNQKQSQS